MKVWKLLIFVLNLVLLGLLITILIKKRKSENFNGLELTGAGTDPWVISLTKQVQENTDAIGDLSPKSIKKLQTDVDDILKMVNPVKKTLTANKVTLGKWSMSNVEENNLQDLLQFCHKGQTGVGGQINGNLVTFRPTGLGQIGQIWTGEVHAPGYLTAGGKGPLAFSPCGQPLIYPKEPHVTPPPLWTQIGNNTSEIGNTNKTIDTFYSVDKDGKVTLAANTLNANNANIKDDITAYNVTVKNTVDAPNAIVDVLDMYPWTMHTQQNAGGTRPDGSKYPPSGTLNFCIKDKKITGNHMYNPIFFKYDESSNLGQIYANTIYSPGFATSQEWDANPCPGV